MADKEKDTATQTAEAPEDSAAVAAQEAQMPEAQDSPAGPGGQIDVLLDTTIPLTVRLGQVDMEIRRLLQMGPGAVVKLDKQVGEPVEVFLRGTKFAHGQLVVVDQKIGVRITEILSGAAPIEQAQEN